MSDTPQISDRCQDCGKEIPALPLEDAFCVGCRYHAPKPLPTGGKSEYEIALEHADDAAPTPWPHRDESPALLILQRLQEIGVKIPDIAAAVVVIEDWQDRHGDERGVEALSIFLSRITRGQRDAEFIGRLCIGLTFRLRLSGAPTNLAELATRLGVGKTRAHQLLAELKLNAKTFDFAEVLAENDDSD